MDPPALVKRLKILLSVQIVAAIFSAVVLKYFLSKFSEYRESVGNATTIIFLLGLLSLTCESLVQCALLRHMIHPMGTSYPIIIFISMGIQVFGWLTFVFLTLIRLINDLSNIPTPGFSDDIRNFAVSVYVFSFALLALIDFGIMYWQSYTERSQQNTFFFTILSAPGIQNLNPDFPLTMTLTLSGFIGGSLKEIGVQNRIYLEHLWTILFLLVLNSGLTTTQFRLSALDGRTNAQHNTWWRSHAWTLLSSTFKVASALGINLYIIRIFDTISAANFSNEAKLEKIAF